MDSLTVDGDEILMLSVAGPETSIKAVNACLQSNVAARFEFDKDIKKNRTFDGEGWTGHCPSMSRQKDGYDCYKHRLGYNMWHLLALSKVDGFMPCLSETALDQVLRSPRFSTPYLKAWVPWLARQLNDCDQPFLKLLDGFQTSAALLKATTDDLDRLITMGVCDGSLTIPAEAA